MFTKPELRNTMRAALAAIPPERAVAASLNICDRLLCWRPLRQATTVMAYVPLPGEADIRPVLRGVLENGKRLCLGRVDWTGRRLIPAVVDKLSDLVEGRYGVLEPPADAAAVASADLDVVLVPGLAFDEAGNRLGRGAGFYDRFLADPAVRGVVCGVAFDAQIVQDVPTDPWDVRLHVIATESRWIEVA